MLLVCVKASIRGGGESLDDWWGVGEAVDEVVAVSVLGVGVDRGGRRLVACRLFNCLWWEVRVHRSMYRIFINDG